MVTIKSYTDIEQSKKLAEILPIESADMCYTLEDFVDEDTGDVFSIEKVSLGHPSDKEIGCWSLAALIDVLPEKYTELIKEGGMYRIIIKDSYMTSLFDNPIDACVAMTIHLNELNLL